MQRLIAQSAVARYGLAVVSVALAVVPALWLRPLALAGAQFLLVAVLITGWVGGLRPALVACGLATLTFKYYFTPPLDSLKVDVAQLPRLIVFAVVALLVATVSAARRKAEDALTSARDGLEEQVRERTGRFRDLVNSVEGIVWEADAATFQFSFVSDQAERILGYPVERWLSEPTFWKDHIHPHDREWAVPDQPVDHRSAWRPALGDTEPGSWRDVPLLAAEDAMTSDVGAVLLPHAAQITSG